MRPFRLALLLILVGLCPASPARAQGPEVGGIVSRFALDRFPDTQGPNPSSANQQRHPPGA
jgi:hypothetical protein